MISVEEAKKIIEANITPLTPVRVRLQEAAGKVLADDIYASVDIPAFPQSSMDGYAFSFTAWKENKSLAVNGEVAAGDDRDLTLGLGDAARIFTGAAVPSGADTVVMQEKIKLVNGALIIEDDNLKPGANVRPRGSEIKAGERAMGKSSFISPAAIGFIAGIGITELLVYPKPSVSIIVTGKELQKPGNALRYGQVYESNSFALTAALQQIGIDNISIKQVDDNLQDLKSVLNSCLENTELVLLTGGISVGDYDFVWQAATDCGVNQLFHKIKQRPGKPLYLGKKENKVVFGLPGNPSSVLSCFYQYVIPVIGKMSNNPFALARKKVPLSTSIQKPAGLTHFLKGYYDGLTVTPLNAQESYRLSSFARANCLIQLNEEVTACVEGDSVEIHILPS
jgi:molybdopterin molybdotransferase